MVEYWQVICYNNAVLMILLTSNLEARMGNIFWNSFLAYDWIIFVFFIINSIIFSITILFIIRLRNLLYPRTDLASTQKHEFPQPHILTKKDVDNLKKVRDRTNTTYSLFSNIITIFPLLGLLGTVIALLGVAGDSGFDNTQQNFLVALTSTLWGVVFAIIFKVLDAFTSPQVDKFDTEVERKKVRYEDA